MDENKALPSEAALPPEAPPSQAETAPGAADERLEPAAAAPDEAPASKTPWWRELLSWLAHIVIPIVVVLLLNTYVCGLVRVKGDSMHPTLSTHDILVVSRLRTPTNGDIVVFHSSSEQYLVKRVIATGGQTVRIDYVTNSVFVDDELVDEPYINYEERDPLEDKGQNEFSVPAGCVFVMGDNRNHSFDSRGFGPVKTDELLGVKVFRLPLGEWLKKK